MAIRYTVVQLFLSIGYLNATQLAKVASGILLQRRTDTDQQQNSESDAFMKVPVFHRDGHQESTNEQHIGVLQILNADLKQDHTDTCYSGR